MSRAEVAGFLAQERTVTCASIGPRGWPHLMPLWYVLREAPAGEPGPRVWAWTYGSSQKVRNLERDPRASLQVEAGEAYSELRGVMLECEVVIHRDLDTVAPLGAAILLRNSVPRGAEHPAELPPRRARPWTPRPPSAWAWSSSSAGARAGTTASSAGSIEGAGARGGRRVTGLSQPFRPGAALVAQTYWSRALSCRNPQWRAQGRGVERRIRVRSWRSDVRGLRAPRAAIPPAGRTGAARPSWSIGRACHGLRRSAHNARPSRPAMGRSVPAPPAPRARP